MNQTVKIFFTDMDDTLLNSEKQVTKENMDAISEALAAGHKIVFNTGRPLSGFLPILKELGLDREGCYAIAFNGGLIYDCAAKKTLYRRTIPLEYARVIFEKTQEAGLYCHTYSDTSLLCRHAGEETRVYTQAIHIPVVEDPLLPEHLAEEPCKMIVIDLHDRAKMDAYCHGAVVKRKNFDVLLQPALPRACPGTRFQGPCREKTLRASSDSACQHRGCRRSGK